MALDLDSRPSKEQLPVIASAESSSGRDVWGPETDSGQAQGDYQITTGTWRDFAPKAGVDLSKYPEPNYAPKDVQAAVAQTIPLGRWDPRTLAKLSGGTDSAARALGMGSIDDLLATGQRLGGQPNAAWLSLPPLISQLGAGSIAERQELGAALQERRDIYKADRALIEKQLEATAVDDTKPWTQPLPPRDALQGFASAGAIFAAIASAFTRTPAISAMNGMAAAINARRDGDMQAYNEAYRVWKDNTELALKRQKMSSDRVTQALELARTDSAEALAELNAIAAEHGDERLGLMAQAGLLTHIAEGNDAKNQSGMQMALNLLKIQNPGVKWQVFNGPDGKSYLFGQGAGGRPLWADPSTGDLIQGPSGTITKPGTSTGAVSVTPEQRKSWGAQGATGQPLTQVVPGWGQKASAERDIAHEATIDQIMSDNPGMTREQAGVELANRNIQFVAGTRSAVQLTTMLGATKAAVSLLEFNVGKVTEELEKLPSTDLSPVFNAMLRGEERVTGHPEYNTLLFYMTATSNEAARIQSGGQASIAQLHDAAQKDAKEWANENITPAAWHRLGQEIMNEGQKRIQNYQDALKLQRVGQTGAGAPTSQAAKTEGEGEPLPKTKAELKQGTMYHTSRGPAVWDGNQFIPLSK